MKFRLTVTPFDISPNRVPRHAPRSEVHTFTRCRAEVHWLVDKIPRDHFSILWMVAREDITGCCKSTGTTGRARGLVFLKIFKIAT